MSTHRGLTVAVISPYLDGFYFGKAHYTIFRLLEAMQVKMIAVRTDDKLDMLIGDKDIDGWIAIAQSFSPSLLDELYTSGKPVVLISCNQNDSRFHSVEIDNRLAVREATRHLIAHGHRRIAFVGSLDRFNISKRYDGFLDALQEHDIDFDPGLLVSTRSNQRYDGFVGAETLLKRKIPFTAAICGNDMVALGFMERLQQAGMRIPEEAAIIGFDDLPPSRASQPSLSSVVHPIEQMAERAVELIAACWNGEVSVTQRHVLPTPIRLRHSCGCDCDNGKASTDTVEQEQEKEQLQLQQKVIHYLETILYTNHEAGKHLLSLNQKLDLELLMPASVRKGFLAMWSEDAAGRRNGLHLKAAYSRHSPEGSEGPESLFPSFLPMDCFPPRDFLKYDPHYPSEVTSIIPIRTENREWGILVTTGEMDTMRLHWNYDAMSHAFDLVALALERNSFQEQIYRMAYHDALTGLPNRLKFEQELRRALEDSEKSASQAAVILLDLDRFKMINDSYGHQAGDAALRHVAERLRACVRKGDLVARLSGDEFVLLLTGLTCEDEARMVNSRILDELRKPFYYDGIEFRITGSLGISFYPEDGRDASTLLRNADSAMYQAKKSGRDQAETYSERLTQATMRRLQLEVALRQAVETGDFEVHYQPQVNLTTGRITGVEALVRWRSGEIGVIPPSEFIPVAEEIGLVQSIDKWVLLQSCRQWKKWSQLGCQGLKLSVNISGKHFARRDFLGSLRSVIRESGMDPTCMCLEITESAAMEDLDTCVMNIRELGHFGIEIAMDDFGIGYSSLSVLKQLPVHIVKIDQTFIRDMIDNEENLGIVKAVIALASGLKRLTVAEGIETGEQLEKLKELGVHLGQGYLIGKPMQAERFTSLLLDN